MKDGAETTMGPSRGDGRLPRFLKFGRVRVHPGYVERLQAGGLNGFSSVFAFDGGERLDKAGLAAWRERRRAVLHGSAGDSCTLYLKRYVRPPLSRQVRRVMTGRPRESTAGREWRTILRLAEAGIPVPEPIAFGQEMRGWIERRSFVVVGQAPGESLEKWLPGTWRRDATGSACRRQRDIVRGLAREVAALHAAGFVHRDLYTSHVFLHCPDGRGKPVFTFIDLQRVMRPRWRRRRWVVKDLASLHYSTERFASCTDRLRFWNEYVQNVGLPRWREALPARITAKSLRIRRRQERRASGGGFAP